MALHKDQNGNIHDDMDGSALHLLPAGCVQITQAEADLILNPPPSAAQLLAAAQAARISFIEVEYVARAYADIAYLGTTFQADEDSQKMIARVLTAQGGATPPGFGYYDLFNAKVLMTNAELQGLAGSILLRNQPLFENRQAKKSAIRAAATVAAVEAVVW